MSRQCDSADLGVYMWWYKTRQLYTFQKILAQSFTCLLGGRKDKGNPLPARSVQCKRGRTIRELGKGIGIGQDDHLFLVRDVSSHVALVDHIRNETFRFFG
jgi:hypothetical protein